MRNFLSKRVTFLIIVYVLKVCNLMREQRCCTFKFDGGMQSSYESFRIEGCSQRCQWVETGKIYTGNKNNPSSSLHCLSTCFAAEQDTSLVRTVN